MSAVNHSTRQFIPMQNKYSRIVVLVDMDCFYCQVEEKLDPSLKGKPLAVVQYNAWRGGGIIAVNYAARAKGVSRHMRGDEAKEQCPDIELVRVPSIREKADLSKYRDAGKDVANVLQRFTPLLERASVDEAYLDITNAVNKRLEDMNSGLYELQPQKLINTYAVGSNNIGEFINLITKHLGNQFAAEEDEDFRQAHDEVDLPAVRQSNIRLLIGASIACEIRTAVKEETGFECSAGIAHNKILAKLACGINKPNKQTIIPLAAIPKHFESLPVGKIRGLGGKHGEEVCEQLGIKFLGELKKFTESDLQKKFDEKNGTWLYYICRGIDLEAVTPRFYSKSIGCCKKFPGRNNITGVNTLKHWLDELAGEICTRLERDISENNRRARQMVVSYVQDFDGEEISSSRSAPLANYDRETLIKCSFEVIQANTKQFFRSGSESVLNNPIKFLGISVGKFETITNAQNKLQEMFAQQAAKNKLNQNCNAKSNNQREDSQEKVTIANDTKGNDKSSNTANHNEEKMKSFFANYLQSKKTIESESTTQEEGEKLNESAKIPDSIRDSIETNTNSSEAKSFFKNVLSNLSAKKDELHENSTGEGNSNIDKMENISILNGHDNEKHSLIINLKPELKEIQYESNPNSFRENNFPIKKRKLNDVEESPLHLNEKSSDYRQDYVEFAVPELRLEHLQFIKCEICKVKVPSDEHSIQLHQDLHFAQQLSQQQREEYRAEIKSKLNQSVTSANLSKKKLKRSPTKSSTTTNNKKCDITKFLKPKSPETPNAILSTAPSRSANMSLDLSDMNICDICQLFVKKSELEEHRDFHVAKELQKQLNLLEVRTVVKTKIQGSNMRRNLNTSLTNSKPITKFFSQLNS